MNNRNIFFQVTAYRQRDDGSTPGRTPPDASSHSSEYARLEDAFEGSGWGKTLARLSQLPVQPAADTTKKNGQTRPRPLPLRKRKLQVNFESDDGEYKPAAVPQMPVGKKRALVRHNMRNDDDGSRVTCKCSKSRCLKLYCDCFQQGKVRFGRLLQSLFSFYP